MGTVHTSKSGARIFYTNIKRREFVEAEFAETSARRTGKAQSELYAAYEHHYLKQIIEYQQGLRHLKRQVSLWQL